ncbi:hypothetical protein DSO57_1018892 [Entomophthora muscae]|uniref:Uncharacterized protein n=1 Tax=Entomophthora muscae TaxID=34485 RepID=A0ACC2RV83_9FUNG|nr:hypothetical protein DSO57_1018892 [Entomophthora muscae]
MDMEPPVTPKPMPASSAKLPLDHTNKLFGILYITLTGVIDTIVPAAGLWLWVGKSMSYLIKLAPILWWALLTQSVTRQFPNTSEPADQGWFPDRFLPDPLQAASLQGQLPGCPQFFGLKPEQDLTLENPLKLDKSNSPTSTPPMLKVPVNSANQQSGPAIDPKITWDHIEGETKKLPIECGPPRDGQPHNPTRKFEHSQFKPANEITPRNECHQGLGRPSKWETPGQGNL